LRKKPFDFKPKTLGEQIKKKRLELGLSQKEAGRLLAVSSCTILNWEKGHTEPLILAIPAVLQFLGFVFIPTPKTIPELLFAFRQSHGLSIRGAAKELGVHFETWRDWEHGKTILRLKHRELVARLLGLNIEKVREQMSCQWNRTHSAEPHKYYTKSQANSG
jgi:transcriptional regulator with XRE-family HTH domain